MPRAEPVSEGDAFSEFAPAKVNLALHVLGRRSDGFHTLDSIVVFADVGDTLIASASDELSLAVEGRFGTALAGDVDNLVLRAARLLAAAAGAPPRAKLVLRKELPVASGIGGGSADAAAALLLLSRMWRVDVPASELAALALKLGADVPVCLAGRPTRMGGVGEELSSLPNFPDCGILLVNPGVPVATQAVFRARSGGFSPPLAVPTSWPDAAALAATLATAGNDLEAPAKTLAPVIGEVLAAIRAAPGCLLARMSGSGATCFGLFASSADAVAAVAGVRRHDWWVWGGGLRR